MSSLKSNYAKNIDFFDAPRLNVIPVALKTHTQMHNRTAQNAAVAGKDVLVPTKKEARHQIGLLFPTAFPAI
tara:strand:+ start:43280 stop:43495 length:216 start_codon:yes stop_codon:yes gene_type:complete